MRLAPRLLAVVLVGCTRPGPAPEPPASVTSQRPAIVSPAIAAPALRIRLLPRLDPTPRLGVELVATGLLARDWQIAALVSADLRDLQMHDDAGPLPHSVRRDGLAVHVTLGRAPTGPLHIAYVLHAQAIEGPLSKDVPAALTLRVDHSRVLASGEEALLLPSTPDEPIAVRLELDASPPISRLASSLGAEPGTPGRARLHDLRHAVFLAGATGHALLRGPAGEDDFAWTGDPQFDLRWSAAETAGARTAVDAYFGATPEEIVRFTALFSVDIDAAGAGTQVVPRGGGLYVALAPGARWNAQARLAVAQGLVHRWIGGRLRLRDDGDPRPEVGAWFGEGFARFVAREVLFDLGTLSPEDYADEVNAHHAVLATAPLRRAPIGELATAAASGDAEAHALLVARGVLYATRVDARIRAKHRGARSLRAVLRDLVSAARSAGLAELPQAAFDERLRGELDAAEVAVFREVVLAGGTLMSPADALGPCFVRGTRVYTRFDLGFDEAASRAVTPGQVRGLRPGGPAARAGVREGERLLALFHVAGDPDTPVELTLERGGREHHLSYRPAGGTGRGDAWRRRPGLDEAQCVR